MKKGFTLIELLATIALLSVLTALVFPTVSNYVSRGEDANAERTAALIEDAMGRYNVLADSAAKTTISDAVTAAVGDQEAIDAAVIGGIVPAFNDIFGGQSEVLSSSTDTAGAAAVVNISFTDWSSFSVAPVLNP